jgi:hypothetical protein
VRGITGDQRFGQNIGDYVYAGLSIVGPKKVLGLSKTNKLVKVEQALPGVEITLEFKGGMDMRDFSRKARALQDLAERGKLSKAPNPVERNKYVTDRYRAQIKKQAEKQWGKTDPVRVNSIEKLLKGRQADHMQDLQVKGSDHSSNLWMLQEKTNRDLGTQLRQQIMNLPDGTPISSIIIKGVK